MDIKLMLIILILLSNNQTRMKITQDLKDLTYDIKTNYTPKTLNSEKLLDAIWSKNFEKGYRDMSSVSAKVFTEPFTEYDFLIKRHNETDSYEWTYLYRQNNDYLERINLYTDIKFPKSSQLSEASIKKLQENYDKIILKAYASPDNKLLYIITENHIVIAESSRDVIIEEKMIFSYNRKNSEKIEIFWINRNDISSENYLVPYENYNNSPSDYRPNGENLGYDKKIFYYYSTPTTDAPRKKGGKFAFNYKDLTKFYFDDTDITYIPKLLETGKDKIASKKINDYVKEYGTREAAIKRASERGYYYPSSSTQEKDLSSKTSIYVFRNDGKILSFGIRVGRGSFKIFNFDSDGNIITLGDIFTVPKEAYYDRIISLIQDDWVKNHDKVTCEVATMTDEEFFEISDHRKITFFPSLNEYRGLQNGFKEENIFITDEFIGIDYYMSTSTAYCEDPLVITVPFEMIEDIINTDLLH